PPQPTLVPYTTLFRSSNQEHARSVVQQVKSLKSWVESFGAIEHRLRSTTELAEMLDAEYDEEMSAELDRDVTRLETDLESFRLRDRKSTRLNSSHLGS